MADISATARVGNFGFRLVDLRPDDGMAPGVLFTTRPQFIGNISSSWAVAFEDTGDLNLYADELAGNGHTAFKPLTARADIPGASATTRMSGRFGTPASRFTLVTKGSLRNDADTPRTRLFTGMAIASSDERLHFELTPYTALQFFGNAQVAAARTLTGPATFQEFAEARVEARFTSAPFRVESYRLSVGVNSDTGLRQAVSQRMRFAFTNDTAEANSGFLDFDVFVRGETVDRPGFGSRLGMAEFPLQSPVPEPGSSALLLCGLGLVGAAARRRRA